LLSAYTVQYKVSCKSQHTYVLYFVIVHPPVVIIMQSTPHADEGEQVTFSCSATGLAAHTFVYGWLLNGRPIKRQKRQTLLVTTSEDSAGDYECTVRNTYGNFGRSRIATLSLSKYTVHCLF